MQKLETKKGYELAKLICRLETAIIERNSVASYLQGEEIINLLSEFDLVISNLQSKIDLIVNTPITGLTVIELKEIQTLLKEKEENNQLVLINLLANMLVDYDMEHPTKEQLEERRRITEHFLKLFGEEKKKEKENKEKE